MTFTHPNQKRSACERCRRQKLRCSRQDADETRCSRCAKLGFECVAGQQRRIGRPSRATSSARADSARHRKDTVCLTDTAVSTPPAAVETHASLDCDLSGSSVNEPTTAPTPATACDASSFGPSIDTLFDGISWDDMARELQQDVSCVNPKDTVEPHEQSGWVAASLQAIDPAVQHEALMKLSKINLDLHSQLTRIAVNRSPLDFCSFIHPTSPLSVGGVTLTELALIAFQDFVGVLAELQVSCVIHRDTSTARLSIPFRPTLPWDGLTSQVDTLGQSKLLHDNTLSIYPISEAIDQPLASMTISCYNQIIEIFEEVLSRIRQRLETLVADPIEPIEGLKFGAFPIGDGHLQGLVFFQIVTGLLTKAERLLCVPPSTPPSAMAEPQIELLSPSQSLLLQGQFSPREGSHIPRPTKLINDIQHMQTLLNTALGA